MIRLRVLIAEADPAEVEELRTALDGWGHSILGIVRHGRDVVASVEALLPDLVLLSVTMPGLDGVEAIRQIMARLPVPIIAVAPHSDTNIIERATIAGVMGYLVRPVERKALGPAIALAATRFEELMALRKEMLRLKDSVTLHQQMQRAKGVMAHRMRVSETDAHKKLQRLAQSERCSLLEAAKRVTAADQFFARLEALA